MATVDVSLFDPQRHRIDALTKRFGDALSGFFVGAKLALQHENHAHPRLLLLSRRVGLGSISTLIAIVIFQS